MAATITLQVDDKTAAGFASMVKNAQLAENAGDDLGDSFSDAEQDMINLANQSRKEFSSMAEKVTAVSTTVSASIEVFSLMRDQISKVNEVVNSLADQGNPAMGRLAGSIDGAHSAFVRLADDPAVQDFADTISSTITDTLIPALDSLPNKVREVQDSIAQALVAAGEVTGILDEGTQDSLRELQGAQREQLRLRREQIAAEREQAKAIEARKEFLSQIQAIEESRFQFERNRSVQELDTLEEVKQRTRTLMDAEQKLFDNRDADGKKRKMLLQELNLLESRRQQISLNNEAKARAKIALREAESRKEALETARLKADLDKQEAARLEAIANKAKAEFNKLRDAILEARGGQPGQDQAKGVIENIREGFTSRQRLAQVTKSRQGDAVEELMNELKEAGLVDANGKAIAQDGQTDREARKFVEARIKKVETDVKRSTFVQNRRGQIGGEEIVKAENDLTKQVIEGAKASGKLSREQVKALEAAANTVTEQAKNQEALLQNVDQILKVTDNALQQQQKAGQELQIFSNRIKKIEQQLPLIEKQMDAVGNNNRNRAQQGRFNG